ncbi:MAG: hypothetical protein HY293_12290 [Planctomycetes bacterium]|nr:hypothetical protein [Planctomycetota bacterium]
MNRFLLGLLLLGLAACGDSSATGKKKYRFALIPKMLSNDVFNYGRMGAEKTAKEIEAKENCEIEIIWQAPAQSNPAQQACPSCGPWRIRRSRASRSRSTRPTR